jgi:hypothetical protein
VSALTTLSAYLARCPHCPLKPAYNLSLLQTPWLLNVSCWRCFCHLCHCCLLKEMITIIINAYSQMAGELITRNTQSEHLGSYSFLFSRGPELETHITERNPAATDVSFHRDNLVKSISLLKVINTRLRKYITYGES